MHFRTQHTYDAPPERVFAMLTDPSFLDGMLAEAPVSDRQVSVNGGHTVITAGAAAPHQLARFTGDHLQVTLEVNWTSATPDGRHTGPISVSVHKLPAKLAGTATIAPVPAGSTVTYDGEFSIGIPIVGKQLEQRAAPYLTQVLDAQQAAGQAWLAAHPA